MTGVLYISTGRTSFSTLVKPVTLLILSWDSSLLEVVETLVISYIDTNLRIEPDVQFSEKVNIEQHYYYNKWQRNNRNGCCKK